METNCNLLESIKANLKKLYDIVTILGLACILPMLEFVNALMKFAQVIDNFVCDYIVIVKYVQNVWRFNYLRPSCKLFKAY